MQFTQLSYCFIYFSLLYNSYKKCKMLKNVCFTGVICWNVCWHPAQVPPSAFPTDVPNSPLVVHGSPHTDKINRQMERKVFIGLNTQVLFDKSKTGERKPHCSHTSPLSDLHVPLFSRSLLLHHAFLAAFHVPKERIQIGAALSQSQRKTKKNRRKQKDLKHLDEYREEWVGDSHECQ